MADKPRSNESRKPASDADVRRAVSGKQDARAEARTVSSTATSASPTTSTASTATQSAKVSSGGFARYTVPAHLGSATVKDASGKDVVLEGGQTAEMSAQDAERIGATPEGEAPAKRPDGALDEFGSTRPEQIPKPADDVKASPEAGEE